MSAAVGRTGTRHRAIAVPVTVLLLFAAVALLASVIAPHDPNRQYDLVTMQNLRPSRCFPLGTDPAARDVLSRALHAARISLGIGGVATLVAITLGAAWGALAATIGPRGDALLMRLVDIALGVPRVLLLIVIVALWGHLAPPVLAAVVGALSWFGTSRLVRAQVRAARERDFVLAATAIGASPARVLLRHVAPHVVGTLAITASMLFGDVVALEAGLSFLGLGMRPPQASWGSMILDGAPAMLEAPWTAAVPIACVVATVLAASALGDALRDRLDPRGGTAEA